MAAPHPEEDATIPPPDGADAPADRGLEAFTGYLMKRAFSVVQADLGRALEPFGLRMLSFSALVVVVDTPDISQSQLAQALAMERSNMVLVLDALEEAGLVTRNPIETDRRTYALRATAAGRETAAQARAAVAAHEARLFAALTDEERSALRAALAKVRAWRR